MTTEETAIPQTIGALRSSIKLTLHTYHALRLWHGRKAAENIVPIIGLNSFLLLTNQMIRGAAQDDPYSDQWMLRIEQKIDDVKVRFAALKEQVDSVFEAVPDGLSLGENLNLEPANLAVFASSPLGFLGIYVLADYDELARKILLARHVALIDGQLAARWLDAESAHHLRSLFTLVQRYRYSGITRDDYVANNAAARQAKEKYGELPQEIVEATLRSRYAPSIYRYEKNRTPVSQEETLNSQTTLDGGVSPVVTKVMSDGQIEPDHSALDHETATGVGSEGKNIEQVENAAQGALEVEETQPPESVPKKAATKSRNSSVVQASEAVELVDTVESVDAVGDTQATDMGSVEQLSDEVGGSDELAE